MSDRRLKLSVFGGCASRDPFQLPSSKVFDVGGAYYPRTSIISQFSPPLAFDLDWSISESQWMKGVIACDFEKTLEQKIRSKPEFGRAIIVDFLVERFDLIKIGDSYVTKSWDFEQTQIERNWIYRDNKAVPRFSDEIWAQTSTKLQKFATMLSENFETVIVHRALYADQYKNTAGTIKNFSASEIVFNHSINQLLTGYYDLLAYFVGDKAIELTIPEYFVANEKHQWGLQPYHYVDEYYEAFLQNLKNHLL